jgi:hypothetical protein
MTLVFDNPYGELEFLTIEKVDSRCRVIFFDVKFPTNPKVIQYISCPYLSQVCASDA